jgi:dual specificity MAP kinase phosphatase
MTNALSDLWELRRAAAMHAVCHMSMVMVCMQTAKSRGGRVLIHCSQGVSRSAALAIAYLMWKRNQPFDEVLTAVKAIRGVANPNIGFTCQVISTLLVTHVF